MKVNVFLLLIIAFVGVVNAQTCNSNMVISKPNAQYSISADGTEVTDLKTGLIWQRCAVGMSWDGTACGGTATPYNWENALAYAATQTGWRLPNLKELHSLVERSCANPAINETAFPNTPATDSDYFWTSSLSVTTGLSNEALPVFFNTGADSRVDKQYGLLVRLVK